MSFVNVLNDIDKRYAWSFIGVLLALFSIIWGAYTFFYEKRPEISFEIVAQASILDVKESLEDLTIQFQGKDIQEEKLDLKIYTVRIQNTGGTNILQSQYDEQDNWGIFVENAKLIDFRFTNTSSDYLKESLKPNIKTDNYLKLEKVIIEKNDYVLLDILVLHKKGINPSIYPTGKIAGIREIIPKVNLQGERNEGFLKQTFSGNIFVQVVRFVSYFVIIVLLVIFTVLLYGKYEKIKQKRASKKRRKIVENLFGSLENIDKNPYFDWITNRYIDNGIHFIETIRSLLGNKKDDLGEIITKVEKGTEKFMYSSKYRAYSDVYVLYKLKEDGIVKIGDEGDKIVFDEEFGNQLNSFLTTFYRYCAKQVDDRL